jgi:hypothetical protein
VFRPLRRSEKTRGQLVRAELNESVSHARLAAGYAAGGVRAAVGPKLAPAKQRARTTAAKLKRTQPEEKTEEKVASRRWPKLAGLLTVGALAGAVGAFVLRRRREHQWESYEPMEAVKEERETATRPATPAAGWGA